MNYCINCGRKLTHNEIGIYKRFVNRGSKEFMCKTCLSKDFNISEEIIDKKIEHYKKMGCTLFE